MAGEYGKWAGKAEDPETSIGHVIPARYPFAEVVPEDGARCSTCYYLSEDRKHCKNTLYQADMKTDELRAVDKETGKTFLPKAERFCCMVWSGSPRTV